jgi:hypothetical protein
MLASVIELQTSTVTKIVSLTFVYALNSMNSMHLNAMAYDRSSLSHLIDIYG